MLKKMMANVFARSVVPWYDILLFVAIMTPKYV
jgi:hypothetical protein